MRKFFLSIIVLWLLPSSLIAQKMILTPYGIRSSAFIMRTFVEYQYKEHYTRKDVMDFCKNNLAQPEFFGYRVDYSDDQIIKVSGYVKDNFKGEFFSLIMEFFPNSIKVSAELFDKNGKPLNCMDYFSKKGKLKDKKFKESVELRIDGFLKSIMGLRVEIRD